jgi:hypothetical protein
MDWVRSRANGLPVVERAGYVAKKSMLASAPPLLFSAQPTQDRCSKRTRGEYAMTLGSTRRTFLGRSASMLAASPVMAMMAGAAFAAPIDASAFPVVETASGKVRGMDFGGVWSFRGIPYGQPTSGKNRFMPPVAVKKWAGVRDAFGLGPTAPQQPANAAGTYTQIISWDQQNGFSTLPTLAANRSPIRARSACSISTPRCSG